MMVEWELSGEYGVSGSFGGLERGGGIFGRDGLGIKLRWVVNCFGLGSQIHLRCSIGRLKRR